MDYTRFVLTMYMYMFKTCICSSRLCPNFNSQIKIKHLWQSLRITSISVITLYTDMQKHHKLVLMNEYIMCSPRHYYTWFLGLSCTDWSSCTCSQEWFERGAGRYSLVPPSPRGGSDAPTPNFGSSTPCLAPPGTPGHTLYPWARTAETPQGQQVNSHVVFMWQTKQGKLSVHKLP